MRKTIFAMLVMLSVLATFAFAQSQEEPGMHMREIKSVRSPAGWCKASVIENEFIGNKSIQVLLVFDKGCGSGSVSFTEADVDLQLVWKDAEHLVIRYPEGLKYHLNAGGERHQCLDRVVYVSLEPVPKTSGQ